MADTFYNSTTTLTTGTHSTNWTGIWSASQAGNIRWTLVQNIVTLKIPTTTSTANTAATITNTVALPSSLRPTSQSYGLLRIVTGGADTTTPYLIGTGGTITIYGTAALGNYLNSGVGGFYATEITYSLA